MKYLKAIGQMFRVNYKMLLIFTGAVLGGAIVGTIAEAVINHFAEGFGILGMGILFSGMIFLIFVIFVSVFGGYSDFVFAVYNSRARNTYIVAKYVYLVCEFALGLIPVAVIYFIEGSLADESMDFIGYMDHPVFIVILILFVMPLIVLLFSALYAKYEKKFFWVMWTLWMLLMIGGPRVINAMSTHPDSFGAKIGFTIKNAFNAGSAESIIGIIVISAIVIVLNYLIYSNVDVRE